MKLLWMSFLIPAAAAVLHLALCRQIRSFKVQIGVWFFLFVGGMLPMAATIAPGTAGFPFSASVLYVLFSLTYFVVFANLDIESPTQRLLMTICQKGKATRDELAEEVTDQRFVLSRLEAMERHGMVSRESGRYRLTFRGLVIARLLVLYQVILGRGMGG